MSSFIPRNLTEIEAVAGCTFACIRYTIFQINCQPFYLRQLLKFHPFHWLIKIYLQTQGQDTHHKMVLLQPMPDFPLCFYATFSSVELCSRKRQKCVFFICKWGILKHGPEWEWERRYETHGKCIELQYKITTSIKKNLILTLRVRRGGGLGQLGWTPKCLLSITLLRINQNQPHFC